MSKKKAFKIIAVVMAFLIAVTSLKEVPVKATGSETGEGRLSLLAEKDNYGDIYLKMGSESFQAKVEEAKQGDQLTEEELGNLITYQEEQSGEELKEELAAAMFTQDADIYRVNASFQAGNNYDVNTFVRTTEGQEDEILFLTQRADGEGFDTDVNVKIGNLQKIEEKEITEKTLSQADNNQAENTEVTDSLPTEDTVIDETSDAADNTTSEVTKDTVEEQTGETVSDDSNLSEPTENTEDVKTLEATEETEKAQTQPAEDTNMLLAVLTVCKTAISATSTQGPQVNKLAVRQEATKTKGQSDYRITLQVNGATSESTETVGAPADVVFVIDASNSMDEKMQDSNDQESTRWGVMKSSLNGMIDDLFTKSPDSKVSIVAYAGCSDYEKTDYKILASGYGKANSGRLKAVYETRELVIRKIYGDYSDRYGATNSKAGFIGAMKALKKFQDTNQKYVIYMSDGMPTLCYEYRDEYDRGGYVDTFEYASESYKSKYGNGSDGSYYNHLGTIKSLAEIKEFTFVKQAVKVAGRLNEPTEFPNTTVYTLGIGAELTPDSIQTKILLNCESKAEGGFDKKYYQASNSREMEEVFKDLLKNVTSYNNLKNVKASDQLSKYVELYTDQPVMVDGNELQPVPNEEGSSILYFDSENHPVVTYTIKTKELQWNVADELAAGKIRTLTYAVHTTSEVESEVDSYVELDSCNKGDDNTGTHARNNGDKEATWWGYRSNEAATVTYKDGKETGSKDFPHPVVQNLQRATLTIKKELAADYLRLSEDTTYTFKVVLTAPEGKKLTADLLTVTPKTEEITLGTLGEGKLEVTVPIRAASKITLGNLPIGTAYEIQETGCSNDYYKVQDAAYTVVDGSGTKTVEDTDNKITGNLNKVIIPTDKEYAFYTIKSGDKVTFYDQNTNQPIENSQLKEELDKAKKTSGEAQTTIGKEVAGKWLDGIAQEDATEAESHKAKINNNETKYYVGLSDAHTIQFQEREAEYQFQNGEVKTTSELKLQNNVRRLTSFEPKYEILLKNGCWRPCEDQGYRFVKHKYYDYEKDRYNRSISYDAKDVQSFIENPTHAYYILEEYVESFLRGRYWKQVNYLTYMGKPTGSYPFNGTDRTTKEELCRAIEAQAVADHLKCIIACGKEKEPVTYWTYEQAYDTQEDYLVQEKDYRIVSKQYYTATLQDDTMSSADTMVTCLNTMVCKTASLDITKKLDKGDIDTATFLFRIENIDEKSPGYGTVIFCSVSLVPGETSKAADRISDLPLGNYKVTEISHMRYEESTTPEQKAANEAVYLITEGGTGEATFTNHKARNDMFSDAAVVVNKGTFRDGAIHLVGPSQVLSSAKNFASGLIARVTGLCAMAFH